jgi:hypothetical protein
VNTPYIDGCISRVARKQHECQARPDTYPESEKSTECSGTIYHGDQYVEYVGASTSYQSGKRYCLPCAEHSLKSEKNEEAMEAQR